MLIWALFAGMTALAAVIVLLPLMRRDAETDAEGVGAGEVSVYRDQLAEVDRDLEAGLVGPVEAEAARAEISRRILKASRPSGLAAVAPSTSRGRSRFVAAVAVVLVPAMTVATYLALGHPDQPDQPLAARKAAIATTTGGQSLEDLVARVEAHLAANPGDARGWEVLAPVYMRMGRMDRAAEAWRTAIRLDGPSERRQNGLGEALAADASGMVTADARAAFEKSLEVAPNGILPRMYLALALLQEGKAAESVAAWRALAARATGDEPWLPTVREELAKAEAAAGMTPSQGPMSTPSTPSAGAAAGGSAPVAAPGPTAADVNAAAQMSPEDRAKMIESMVGRLRDRLAASGGTIDEWERLVRAERNLGRDAEAEAAIAKARAAYAGDAAALARLDTLTAGPKP